MNAYPRQEKDADGGAGVSVNGSSLDVRAFLTDAAEHIQPYYFRQMLLEELASGTLSRMIAIVEMTKENLPVAELKRMDIFDARGALSIIGGAFETLPPDFPHKEEMIERFDHAIRMTNIAGPKWNTETPQSAESTITQ